MKFSIIIVTFNNEPHIAEAIRSAIFAQCNDYEVIVVYNKSDDNTLSVIRSETIGKEDLFNVIENNENVGLGEARNQGVRAAKGDYVMFLDGDDFLDQRALSRIDQAMNGRNPDVLYYNFLRLHVDGRVALNRNTNLLREGWRRTTASRASLFKNFGVAWNRLYKRRFILDQQLYFQSGLYEDILWNIQTICLANSIYVVPDALVIYRQRAGSILKTSGRGHFDTIAQHGRIIDFLTQNPSLLSAYAKAAFKYSRQQMYRTLLSKRVPPSMKQEYLKGTNKMLKRYRVLSSFRICSDERIANMGNVSFLRVWMLLNSWARKKWALKKSKSNQFRAEDNVLSSFVFEGSSQRFVFRHGSVGDRGVVKQVFKNREYQMSDIRHAEALDRFYSTLSKHERPLIVDAGANIGASAVYFRSQYPGAFVFAIEPEEENCKLFERNLSALQDWRLFRGAFGSGVGKLFLNKISDLGNQVRPQGEIEVDVIDCATIVHEMKKLNASPFILKIDIEGSEEDVFSGDSSWLDQFPCVIIELHDWMLPFSGSSRNFQRAIARLDFDLIQRGENLFCFNRRILKEYL